MAGAGLRFWRRSFAQGKASPSGSLIRLGCRARPRPHRRCEVDLAGCSCKGRKPLFGRLRLRRCSLRRRDADKAQALPASAVAEPRPRKAAVERFPSPTDSLPSRQLVCRLRRRALERRRDRTLAWQVGCVMTWRAAMALGPDRRNGGLVVLSYEDRRAARSRLAPAEPANPAVVAFYAIVLRSPDQARVSAHTSARSGGSWGQASRAGRTAQKPGFDRHHHDMSQRCRTYSISLGGLPGRPPPRLLAIGLRI